MKILHLLSDSRFTGPAQPVLQLAEELLRRGHDVRLGINRRPPSWRISKKIRGEGHFLFVARRLKTDKVGDFEKEILQTAVPVVEELDLNRYFNIRGNLRNFFALRDLLRRERFDILHLHLPHDHWIGALAEFTSNSGANVVATFHKVEPPHHGPSHRYLYNRMIDRIVVVSEKSRQMALKHLDLHSRNARIVRGAVDTEKYHPGISGVSIRQELGIPLDSTVIGMVARFQPHREHALLVRAASKVVDRFPHARFLMIGRGEHKEEVERLVRHLGLEKKVLFAGYRKDDYPEAVAAMDVLFFSVPGSDGTCRAVLETMSVGRPVISFALGVLPETIDQNVTGWIIPPNDLGALEEALIESLRSGERLREMGEAARKVVCQRHSILHQGDVMEEFYADLIEEKQYLISRALVTAG